MQIVIDISEDVYRRLKDGDNNGSTNAGNTFHNTALEAIGNGVVLPNGHGRLIDADEALTAMGTWDKFGFDHTCCFVREPKDDYVTYVHYEDMVKAVNDTPTILEADKEADKADRN